MWWIVAALAAPPEGVDTADLARWEAGSERLLAGPAGCWVLGGKLALTGVTYTPASLWSRSGREDHAFRGSFLGRLEEGRWTQFDYDLSPADAPGEPAGIDFPIMPAFGILPDGVARRTNPAEADDTLAIDGGSDGAVNLLQEVLEGLEPATSTAYAEWREADRTVRLLQDVPVSKKARAETVTVETTFPGGGAATALDARFPTRLRVGEGLARATVFDAQLHLRGQPAGDVVLPALDSLSFGVGAFGFTVAYEQELGFETATRCP
jgi:hypothetical protein